MDIFFPTQTLSLFQAFAPCFTAPSFAYFQSYMWALMVVEGRKCMTRLARCAFFHQRDLSSCQFFAPRSGAFNGEEARVARTPARRYAPSKGKGGEGPLATKEFAYVER
jgi:hypothetical protein